MGRQSGDPTIVSTSIALLQERFRQLEREKEKREERQLLKLFSESDRMAPTMRFQSNQFQSQRPALQDSLSLGLNLQSKHADYRATSTSTNFLPNSAPTASTSRNFENSDVDTSLHL